MVTFDEKSINDSTLNCNRYLISVLTSPETSLKTSSDEMLCDYDYHQLLRLVALNFMSGFFVGCIFCAFWGYFSKQLKQNRVIVIDGHKIPVKGKDQIYNRKTTEDKWFESNKSKAVRVDQSSSGGRQPIYYLRVTSRQTRYAINCQPFLEMPLIVV